MGEGRNVGGIRRGSCIVMCWYRNGWGEVVVLSGFGGGNERGDSMR